MKETDFARSLCYTVSQPILPGGIGEAVCGAVAMEGIRVKRLAVNGLPRSGPPMELLDMFGISARHVVEAVKSF